MIHQELRCSAGARETLNKVTEKENNENLAGELIRLLFKERGNITERGIPRYRFEMMQSALSKEGLENSVRIAYAGSIKSDLQYGDVSISINNRFDDRIRRTQLAWIAKMTNPQKAQDALISFMEEQSYGFTIDKFPYDTFSQIEALAAKSIYRNRFTFGFAFTIKEGAQQSYGTAFFSMEKLKPQNSHSAWMVEEVERS